MKHQSNQYFDIDIRAYRHLRSILTDFDDSLIPASTEATDKSEHKASK